MLEIENTIPTKEQILGYSEFNKIAKEYVKIAIIINMKNIYADVECKKYWVSAAKIPTPIKNRAEATPIIDPNRLI